MGPIWKGILRALSCWWLIWRLNWISRKYILLISFLIICCSLCCTWIIIDFIISSSIVTIKRTPSIPQRNDFWNTFSSLNLSNLIASETLPKNLAKTILTNQTSINLVKNIAILDIKILNYALIAYQFKTNSTFLTNSILRQLLAITSKICTVVGIC